MAFSGNNCKILLMSVACFFTHCAFDKLKNSTKTAKLVRVLHFISEIIRCNMGWNVYV